MSNADNLQVMSPRGKRSLQRSNMVTSSENLFNKMIQSLSPHKLESPEFSPVSKMPKTSKQAVGDDEQAGSSSSFSIKVTQSTNPQPSATTGSSGNLSEAELKNVILELEQATENMRVQGQQYIELQQERFQTQVRSLHHATREHEQQSRDIAAVEVAQSEAALSAQFKHTTMLMQEAEQTKLHSQRQSLVREAQVSLHESQEYIKSEAESHIQSVQSKAGGDAEQAMQYAALCKQELQTMKEEMVSNTLQYNECLSEFAEFEMSARNSNLETGVELAMARSTGQIFYHEVEANYNSRMISVVKSEIGQQEQQKYSEWHARNEARFREELDTYQSQCALECSIIRSEAMASAVKEAQAEPFDSHPRVSNLLSELNFLRQEIGMQYKQRDEAAESSKQQILEAQELHDDAEMKIIDFQDEQKESDREMHDLQVRYLAQTAELQGKDERDVGDDDQWQNGDEDYYQPGEEQWEEEEGNRIVPVVSPGDDKEDKAPGDGKQDKDGNLVMSVEMFRNLLSGKDGPKVDNT